MNQYIRVVIFSFLIFFEVQDVFSFNNSQPEFQQISYMQGLPGTTVVKQIQDHFGIMWIIVEAKGICRYDGHEFTSYMHDPKNPNSISSNFVNDFIEDVNGDIWIATIDGLNKYDRSQDKFIVYKKELGNPKSIHNNICNTLYFDELNYLWVGTDEGLARMNIDNETFRQFYILTSDEQKINSLSVFTLVEYPKGIFWIGSNQGIIKYEIISGKYEQWKKEGLSINEPCENRIICIKPDSLGNLWIGTQRGLDRFDLNTQKFNHWRFTDKDQPFYEKAGINNILVDSDGSVCVGTFSDGLFIIDPKTDGYKIFSIETGGDYPLRSNHIKYTLEDSDGNFWIGTKFEGIFKINKSINIFNNWPKHLSLLKELRSKYFFSIFKDKDDVLWLGTKTDGLFRLDLSNQEIKNYQLDPFDKKSIASNRVIGIIRDHKDNLFIATTDGFQFMDEKNESFSMIKNVKVNDLFIDNRSTLWVCASEGLYVLNEENNTLEFFNAGDKYTDFFQSSLLNIQDIIQDSNGLLWFSSRENGLFSYDYSANELNHYTYNETSSEGLNSNMTRFCFEDSRGFIWIGTKAGGLNKFDPSTSTFSNYMIKDGLPSNLILCMQEDNEGNLWIGTHNGISKFNVNDETFENFNSDYGLLSNVIERNGSWKFKNGELLFGGNDGFNVFYPEDIRKIESNTPIMITSVKVFDRLIQQDIDSVANIENDYDENFISFGFCLMDYKYPFRHEYEYFLEGFDDDWNKSGNRNYASYTSLPPGKYTFRVRAANEMGNWSNSSPVCHIVIKPAFYNTIGFKVVVLLLVLSSLFVLYQRKMDSINRTKMKLEGMIAERTKKLNNAFEEIKKQKKEIEQHQKILEKRVEERTHDLELAKKRAEESDLLKSSFLANMSHEIRTPLNAICGFSSMMNDEDTDDKMREEYSEIINSNSNQLLNLIEDILDISKIEAGQLKINKSSFNVNQLLAEIVAMLIEELKKKGKEKIHLTCPVIEKNLLNIDLITDQYRLKQVLVNLLNNAIKFTSEGSIEFGYKIKENFAQFYVSDTGIGIANENLYKVFDRFTKVEKLNSLYGGTGIGLSISKSIVELFGGEIHVESELGKGTTFTFTVPYSEFEKS